MNDILFIGKTCNQKNPNDNGIWLEMFYAHSMTDGRVYPVITDNMTFEMEVIPETVGIYIGISDKRGAKLFVGSIFSYTEHAGYNMSSFTAEVVFDKECASFGYRKLGLTTYGVKHEMIHHFCEHDELSVDVLPYVELIGNIHDTIK